MIEQEDGQRREKFGGCKELGESKAVLQEKACMVRIDP